MAADLLLIISFIFLRFYSSTTSYLCSTVSIECISQAGDWALRPSKRRGACRPWTWAANYHGVRSCEELVGLTEKCRLSGELAECRINRFYVAGLSHSVSDCSTHSLYVPCRTLCTDPYSSILNYPSTSNNRQSIYYLNPLCTRLQFFSSSHWPIDLSLTVSRA